MKLSVMMITYNHEKFIAQALASILEQRVNFDYEVVVGEDFSRDATREILMDFHRRYPGRIVPLLNSKNVGLMKNFWATLAACRGDYVAFLEGDDYWTQEDKLQKQVDFLDAHPSSSLCCHRVRLLDKEGIAGLGLEVFPVIPSGQYTLPDLLKSNFVMTCSAVLRRNLIGPLPSWFFNLSLADWPLFALVARHGSIELMDETMAAYRVHPTSAWSSRPPSFRLRESSRMLKALDKHLDYKYSHKIRETIALPYLYMAEAARLNGNRIETAKHLISCLRNGGRLLPRKRRILAGLAAYALMGSWYKVFSKAKS